MNKDESKLFVLVLKNYAARMGIRHQTIADRTGLSQPHVTRLFGLKYSPRIDVIFSIASAMGLEIILNDKKGGNELIDALKDAEIQLKTMSNEEI